MSTLVSRIVVRVAAALALGAAAVAPALAGPQIGVSIDVHHPGVFGHVQIGPRDLPVVYVPQPVLVVRGPREDYRPPVYVYAPPPRYGHGPRWVRHERCEDRREARREYRREQWREARRDEWREDRRDDWRDRRDDR